MYTYVRLTMKHIILLGIMMLFFGMAFSQSIETVSTADFDIRDSINNEYNLIRTDLEGNIIWSIPIDASNNPFDFSHGTYLVCGFTSIEKGKIIDNPCDYDYWIVKIINDITIDAYPNPASREFNIALSSYTSPLDFYLYDVQFKLLRSFKLTNFITQIQVPELSNGLYLYNIISNNKLIKTGKVCIMQND